MGRRGKGKGGVSGLNLMLNLSPPGEGLAGSSSDMSIIAGVDSLSISSLESNSSSGTTQLMVETDTHGDQMEMSMVLVGCQTCLMYFMLSELDLKCPKCRVVAARMTLRRFGKEYERRSKSKRRRQAVSEKNEHPSF